ncbi:hypothetical protein [Empedobacter tilapiae]
MSKITIVGGDLIEYVGGSYKMYIGESLEISSNKNVIFNSESGVITHGTPENPPPEEIPAKCVVHFRSKNNWQGEDYGFDWMRLGETTNFGDTKYEDIVAKQYTDATYTTLVTNTNQSSGSFKKSPTLYNNLKNVYSFYSIPWRLKDDNTPEEYFVPWLSLYPSKIRNVETGEMIDSAFQNTKALLSVIVDVEEEPDTIKFKENEYFTITPMEITTKTVGKHTVHDHVTIECIKEFSTDQTIEVIATKRDEQGVEITELAGKLRVWANNTTKRKKANVLIINLQTNINGPITGDSTGQKELFEKYLRQALIECNVVTRTLDLSSDPNLQVEGRYVKDGQIIGYYEAESYSPYRANPRQPADFITLENYIYNKLQEQLTGENETRDMYNTYFKAIYLGENGGYVNPQNVLRGLNGYSSGQNVVLFPAKNDQTAAHEFLHSFTLPHSFTNSEADSDALYTYTYAKTENIMDYSHQIPEVRYSLWKWQWEKANAHIR